MIGTKTVPLNVAISLVKYLRFNPKRKPIKAAMSNQFCNLK